MGKWARNMREQSPINSICSFKIQINTTNDLPQTKWYFIDSHNWIPPGTANTTHPWQVSQVTWRPAVSVTARSTKVSSRRRFSSILCLVAFCVRSILRCLVTSGESSLQCHNMSTVSRAFCSFTRCLQCHVMSAVTWDVCSVSPLTRHCQSGETARHWDG